VPLRRVTAAQIVAAKKFQRLDPAEVDQRELCQALFGHDFIFHNRSARHVEVFINEIIGTWEHQRRLAQRHPTGDIEVQAIRIGDAAIVGFGCELFCEVKHDLQQVSPFPHTLFAAMANGGNGYVPIREAFEHGGYETCTGIASQFTEGAAELLRDRALWHLNAVRT